MKKFGVYNGIVETVKHQLFAKIPKEYLPEFRAYVFANNAMRFSFQTICMVLMDAGLLILYFFRQPVDQPAAVHVIILTVKMIMMGTASYMLARIGKQPYDPTNRLHRSLSILFPIVYIVSDVLVCITGPHSLGNYMRLFAIPIIAGSITVINQAKSSIILFALYTFYFFWLPHMEVVALLPALASSYNFWFVVFATNAGLSASVYSQFVNNFVVTKQLKQTSEKHFHLNGVLERDVNQRTKLLQTVNLISDELLGSSNETFTTALHRSMKQIGTVLEVDRVYIWKNERQGEALHCSQVYEWSCSGKYQQGGDSNAAVPFPDGWFQNLSENKCVNGVVKSGHNDLRKHPPTQGMLSIIVVPVFIFNEFWGFVGFDDCRNERLFNDIEEAILRTISLLFATSVLRNEMTSDLMRTTEIALAASRAKSEFLANISHEIRTPLNAITGMSSVARRSNSIDEIHRFLERINASIQHLLSIINDVLDMSKIEAGKIEMLEKPFSLIATLHNVKSIIGAQTEHKQLNLVIELSPDLPETVIGDETRLSQVLINLLSNAVKFTPKGGHVYFTAEAGDSPSDEFIHLIFAIRDTGIGIDAAMMQKLFNKFEQADTGMSREFGGTGLGLAITKRIVEMMQGRVEVESEIDKGSCFTVHVLLRKNTTDTDVAVTRGKIETMAVSNIFANRRALLVEDIEINREIIIEILRDTGMQIDVANNGESAVEIFKDNPGLYDMIFMDLQMPIMDGFTATEQIRALDIASARSVPILAMTANVFVEDIRHCMDCGMNDHIAKPIDYIKLIEKIKKYLH